MTTQKPGYPGSMAEQEGGQWNVATKENEVYLERVSEDNERLFDDSLAPEEARQLARLLTKHADRISESSDSDEDSDEDEAKADDSDEDSDEEDSEEETNDDKDKAEDSINRRHDKRQISPTTSSPGRLYCTRSAEMKAFAGAVSASLTRPCSAISSSEFVTVTRHPCPSSQWPTSARSSAYQSS